MKRILLSFLTVSLTHIGVARAALSWDLGGSAGSYSGASYTEINLGLNWQMTDYFVWRNALFGRFPSGLESVYGLDTTARFQTYAQTDGGTFGIGFFGGPGYRFSKIEYTAAFIEAGLILKLGGLNIGGGIKQFYYSNPGLNSTGQRMPNSDTVVFLILGGGGSL